MTHRTLLTHKYSVILFGLTVEILKLYTISKNFNVSSLFKSVITFIGH